MTKKELVNYYKYYEVYEITSETGDIIFNGECEHNKTLTGKTHQDILHNIDEYWKQKKILEMIKRSYEK